MNDTGQHSAAQATTARGGIWVFDPVAVEAAAQDLAQMSGSMVAVTGAIDDVTSGARAARDWPSCPPYHARPACAPDTRAATRTLLQGWSKT